MKSQLSLDQFEQDLKDFKTFLDTQSDNDEDVKQLKTHLSEASVLLEKKRNLLISRFRDFMKTKYPHLYPNRENA